MQVLSCFNPHIIFLFHSIISHYIGLYFHIYYGFVNETKSILAVRVLWLPCRTFPPPLLLLLSLSDWRYLVPAVWRRWPRRWGLYPAPSAWSASSESGWTACRQNTSRLGLEDIMGLHPMFKQHHQQVISGPFLSDKAKLPDLANKWIVNKLAKTKSLTSLQSLEINTCSDVYFPTYTFPCDEHLFCKMDEKLSKVVKASQWTLSWKTTYLKRCLEWWQALKKHARSAWRRCV